MSKRAEQARRLAAARKKEQEEARRRRRIRVAAAVAVALVVPVVAVAVALAGRESGDNGDTAVEQAWPAKPEGLTERLAPFKFPPPGDESYHAHVLLSVYRDGKQIGVPANIGFDARGSHSSLHTHTPDGVIHMEADDPYPYELRHVFAAWGVPFDNNRLGDDVASGTKKVFVYVNGEPAPSGGAVVLKDRDNVVVAYGEPGSFPTEPPTEPLEAA